jgi:hypothetical protein
MNIKKLYSSPRLHWMCFVLALVLIVIFYTLYGINIVRWRNSPDFGWRPLYDSGPNVVAQIFESGEAAGLRVGDTIQALNGQTYNTFEELFKIRREKPGSVNAYKVLRGGETFEINVTTKPLGLRGVFWRSGFFFITGLIYVVIGVLVFLMKPNTTESWIFFAMTSFIGMTMSYYGPSDLMGPRWLYDARLFFHLILPAAGVSHKGTLADSGPLHDLAHIVLRCGNKCRRILEYPSRSHPSYKDLHFTGFLGLSRFNDLEFPEGQIRLHPAAISNDFYWDDSCAYDSHHRIDFPFPLA